MSHNGWIGIDLDATLAEYTGWRDDGSIGPPIPKMVERVKKWLKEGKNVKIMTARVSSADKVNFPDQSKLQQGFIQEWCLKHLGQILPITAEKDYHMYQLWDDRAVQVYPNTGDTLEERIAELEGQLEEVRSELYYAQSRYNGPDGYF